MKLRFAKDARLIANVQIDPSKGRLCRPLVRHGKSLPACAYRENSNPKASLEKRPVSAIRAGGCKKYGCNQNRIDEVNLTVTVPAEITGGTDVFISVTGHVVRVEDFLETNSKKVGVAATIDRYEVFRSDAASS